MDDGDSRPILESYRKLNSVYNYLNRIPITSDNFSLDRGLKNSVVVPFMARYHCQFKKGKNNEWTLEDNSTFGIKVNGVTLGNGLEKKLCDGDIISLGCTDEFVYKFLNSPSKVFAVPRKSLNNGRKWNGIEEHLRAEIERKFENRTLMQIKKLKGRKNEVECQKTIVPEEKDAQLETTKLKYEIEEKMSKFMDRKNSIASLHLCPMPLALPLAPVAFTRGSDGTPLPVARSPPPRRGADKMRQREEIQKQLSEAQNNAEKLLAAERIQKQAEQSVATNRILHEQLGKLKFQLQTLETERNTILEDICARENCGEGSSKEVVLNEMSELMESELQCSICNEVFVEPTTLNCSHTFCKYCISVWRKNKKDCPLCRASIKSECKSLALNSFIEKMVLSLSEEMKQKRKQILEERKGL